MSKNLCSFEPCDKTEKSKGLCDGHYAQLRRRGTLSPLGSYEKGQSGMDCSFEGCDRKASSKKLCDRHYRQQLYGKPLTAIRRRGDWQKRAGRYVNRHGYVILYMPDSLAAGANGCVSEHRHIMSKHLGRPLLSHETVHHKNGQRDDNRIENLELWSRSQPAGQRVVDKVQWAKEIIDLYSDLLN